MEEKEDILVIPEDLEEKRDESRRDNATAYVMRIWYAPLFLFSLIVMTVVIHNGGV